MTAQRFRNKTYIQQQTFIVSVQPPTPATFCSRSRRTCTQSAEHCTPYSSCLKVRAFSRYRPATSGLRQRWREIKHPAEDCKTGIQESKSLFPPFAQLLWRLQSLEKNGLTVEKHCLYYQTQLSAAFFRTKSVNIDCGVSKCTPETCSLEWEIFCCWIIS